MDDLRLIGVPEVARVLDISLARAYELIRWRALPAVHLGHRQVRVSRAALARFVAEGGTATSSSQERAA